MAATATNRAAAFGANGASPSAIRRNDDARALMSSQPVADRRSSDPEASICTWPGSPPAQPLQRDVIGPVAELQLQRAQRLSGPVRLGNVERQLRLGRPVGARAGERAQPFGRGVEIEPLGFQLRLGARTSAAAGQRHRAVDRATIDLGAQLFDRNMIRADHDAAAGA